MKDKRKKYLKMLIVFIVISVIAIGVYQFEASKESKVVEITYNELLEKIENKEIKSAQIDFKSEDFTVTTTSEDVFKTDNPKKDDFKEFLLLNDIDIIYAGSKSERVNMIFNLSRTLILLGFFYAMLKSVNLSMFKKKDSLIKDIPNTNFLSVAGHTEAKEEMEFLVEFLKSPDKYHEMGAKLPKGVVLYGPPGTGKTLTAKAIAGEAGVPFYSVSGSDFIEMYAGLGAKRVRDLFSEAKKNAPCIVFIDEIDAIGSHRQNGPNNNESNQTINALLAELDGFEERESIVVMVATNRVEDLDRALIRPGRFDRQVAIGLPDNNDRLEILGVHVKGKKLSKGVNLEQLAKITIGFSGAGLESMMNEAAILAVNNNKQEITMKEIDDAYFKIVMRGHEKKNSERTKENIETIAYHEAGHALVSKLLTDNSIPKVTIIPSTSGAGGVTFNIPKQTELLSKEEYLNNIKILYAGRAAEYILRKDETLITTGASNDLMRATEDINSYFTVYGMSEKFGNYNVSDKKMFLDEAVNLSKELYSATVELLKSNEGTLIKIANELIEKETITEDIIDTIIGL